MRTQTPSSLRLEDSPSLVSHLLDQGRLVEVHYRGTVRYSADGRPGRMQFRGPMEGRRAANKERKPTARIKPTERPQALERELLSRIDRAEGQLRGVRRMVAENAYCIDILQQISAVRGALQKLALILLRDHLESCVSEAMLPKHSNHKIQELIETLDRFVS
jgi:CsoR family transcriptional regulator, copper-sensing transcriptional repressor